jgi:RNA polymerase sigma-70 factor (ECF subfamily)
MENRAFERAVLEHKDRLHAYATLMLRDPAEAQDVAQEAMMRLWENRQKVEAGGAKPWLTRTVHNLCIDRIRKRRVRSEVGDGETVMLQQSDDGPSPQRRAEAGEMSERILASLETLAPPDRAVLLLREVQGMAYDEIARVLGVPLGTLKARLHRARERLRTRLARAGMTP